MSLAQDLPVTFSSHWSYNFRGDPKRLAFVMARYKFAADVAGKNRTVLELGCGEGIGAPLMRKEALHYTGVDLENESIKTAVHTFSPDDYTFIYDDFMGKKYGSFQTVISLDVVEHILPEHEADYFKTIVNNLKDNGVAVIGTPNQTSAAHASVASQLGHVNLFTQERLKKTLEQYFHTVFTFGMNDEVVHTGFAPMAHYIFCVACDKREI